MLELLYACDCGQEMVIKSKQAKTLKHCDTCGRVNKLPGLEAFTKHMKLMQRSQQAFVEENEHLEHDMPIEKFRLIAKGLKFSCLKRQVCFNCLKHYDACYTSEINGFCTSCVKAVSSKIEANVYSSIRPVKTQVNYEPVSPLADQQTKAFVFAVVGVFVGFLLGGIAAFSSSLF